MLLSDLQDVFNKYSVLPSSELVEYIKSCDSFSDRQISSIDFCKEMCKYLDNTAMRMQALSAFINRTKEPPMADVFTEAVNLMVRSIINLDVFQGSGLHVSSERNFRLKNNKYIKPDVGIWIKDQLVGAIECKTNFGYDRNNWMNHFDERIMDYTMNGVKQSSIMLMVATESNWAGFPIYDKRTNTQWFSLCRKGSWFAGKNGSLKLSQAYNGEVIDLIINKILEMV